MHYIMVSMAAAVGLMAIVMVAFVYIWSNIAITYDAKSDLSIETRKNAQYVNLVDGELVFSDEYVEEKDEVRFLVVKKDGTVVAGSYPEGFLPEKIRDRQFKYFRSIRCGFDTFYIRDVRREEELGDEYVVRGIVRKRDLSNRYQMLEYVSYVGIVLVFVMVMAGAAMVSRRMSQSMTQLCDTAENIGENLEISQRFAYTGRFRELVVLTQAENRMLDRIEETIHDQEQFASDVAHELRTPMAVITAQCQYIAEKKRSEEERNEAFEVITRQAGKMNDVIFRLLDLSRLNRESIQIQKEDVDLPEIVQSVCEDEQDRLEGRITIRQSLARAHAEGDIGLIMMAVQNLVTNAIKAGAEDAVIDVSTGTCDGMAYVKVQDYGVGIPREELDNIFKRFYKVDKSRHSQGYGLGLPLTKKIAARHGGTVTVESRVGEGSTFTLLLPEKASSREIL